MAALLSKESFLYRRFANHTDANSVATQMRRLRFELLLKLLKDQPPGPIRILDIGGCQPYWDQMAEYTKGLQLHVTLLNLDPPVVTSANFSSYVGDARAMPQFADKSFDLAFSNSTIEHVGTFDDQRRMAAEVRRVAKRYFVQTPNLYFPIEPHFLFPMFQFLPVGVRTWMLQHWDIGWISRKPDYREARAEVESIRLLSKGGVRELFPDATIFEERFLGMSKSFVAYRT